MNDHVATGDKILTLTAEFLINLPFEAFFWAFASLHPPAGKVELPIRLAKDEDLLPLDHQALYPKPCIHFLR